MRYTRGLRRADRRRCNNNDDNIAFALFRILLLSRVIITFGVLFTVTPGSDTARQEGPAAFENRNAHVGQKLHNRPDQDHMRDERRTRPIQEPTADGGAHHVGHRGRWFGREADAAVVGGGGDSGGRRNWQTTAIGAAAELGRIDGPILEVSTLYAAIVTIPSIPFPLPLHQPTTSPPTTKPPPLYRSLNHQRSSSAAAAVTERVPRL